MRVLRAAAAAAATGDRRRVRALVAAEGERVRQLDDELRALVAEALALVERSVSRARGEAVRAHTRGRLLGAVALSAALAACHSPPPLALHDAGVEAAPAENPFGSGLPDASRAADTAGDDRLDATMVEDGPGCPSSLISRSTLPFQGCGELQAEVTFDARGVPDGLQALDGGMLSQAALDCLHRLLAGYCYPSYAGTTQLLVSHHIWIA